MPQPRNPYTLLIIGTAIGAVLGAVIGIAIGQSAASAGARVTSVRTVVSTRTIRVAGLGGAPTSASTRTQSTDTTTTATSTDTTPSFTSTTDTTPSFTTTTDTTLTTPTTTTDTGTSSVAPNDVPPTDPYNPPANFCKTHVCAPGFSKGFGFVVQCADGVWSMQGGQTTVCRNDGGVP